MTAMMEARAQGMTIAPPTRRSSIETIPLALPARRSSTFEADAHPPLEAIGARRSSTFEVDALRPLAAIEDQGRRKSSSTRP